MTGRHGHQAAPDEQIVKDFVRANPQIVNGFVKGHQHIVTSIAKGRQHVANGIAKGHDFSRAECTQKKSGL
jgi:hypothetical protein